MINKSLTIMVRDFARGTLKPVMKRVTANVDPIMQNVAEVPSRYTELYHPSTLKRMRINPNKLAEAQKNLAQQIEKRGGKVLQDEVVLVADQSLSYGSKFDDPLFRLVTYKSPQGKIVHKQFVNDDGALGTLLSKEVVAKDGKLYNARFWGHTDRAGKVGHVSVESGNKFYSYDFPPGHTGKGIKDVCEYNFYTSPKVAWHKYEQVMKPDLHPSLDKISKDIGCDASKL